MDGLRSAICMAIRHIGTGTYSSGSIYRYLIEKGCNEAEAHMAVDELVETKYIDDYKACRKILLLRTGRKQESKLYTSMRLQRAGIDERVIDEYISSLSNDDITCSDLLKAYAMSSNEEGATFADSFIKLAKSRGYSFETISVVLNRNHNNE